jgi:hypothetical protein
VKLSLTFSEDKQLEERFQYPNEDAALEMYLDAYPNASAYSGKIYCPFFALNINIF